MKRYEFDAVVAGSGGSGMTAALAAADAGCKTLLVESSDLLGGSTSLSGGGMWIPANPFMERAGLADSIENANRYLDAIVPDKTGPANDTRRMAYLNAGPAMVRWLESLGFPFFVSAGYSDYYPEKPGGTLSGRCLEAGITCEKDIPQRYRKLIRRNPAMAMPLHANEGAKMSRAAFAADGMAAAMKMVFGRLLPGILTGNPRMGMGAAIIGQLLCLLDKSGAEVWLSSPIKQLLFEDGKVVGCIVTKDGEDVEVFSKGGVMLACGGFEHNQEMREQFQQMPVNAAWSVGAPSNIGTGIRLGMDAGAAVSQMEKAWWMPTLILDDTPGADPWVSIYERSMPHGMVVGKDGKRFCNEAGSYLDFGYAYYAHNRDVECIPAWLIFDMANRKRYMLGMNPGGSKLNKLVAKGLLFRDDTLADLAAQIGVDPAGLAESARKMGEYAKTGKDPEFGRGDSAYDHLYADPANKPNPNLGSIEQPPFFAIKIFPGDLGTMGGLLTDEDARVLREDGSVIEGLYAAGNNAASVFGGTYPGPGSTVGPGMVFGMLGGRHMAARAKA